LQQAWEAAVAGVPLERFAQEHQELREALAKFA
jgi:ribulose-bisphosphate carboxylase large chain